MLMLVLDVCCICTKANASEDVCHICKSCVVSLLCSFHAASKKKKISEDLIDC